MPAPSTPTPARPWPAASEAYWAHLAAQGAAIQHARTRAGLTQPAAAARLGVPLPTYRSWEQGRRGCPPAVRAWIVAEWKGDAALLGSEVCPCCGRPLE
jgi:hypothetical protein